MITNALNGVWSDIYILHHELERLKNDLDKN